MSGVQVPSATPSFLASIKYIKLFHYTPHSNLWYNSLMSWKRTKPPFAEFKKNIFQKAGAVAEFIYQIGEYKELRLPSKDVPLNKINTEEFKSKVRYLKDCLLKYRSITGYGRGITAVQIGIPERFSVIYTPEKLIIIINPKITKKSSKILLYPEICMSANPIIVPTIRPAWIEFSYYDEEGKLQYWNIRDNTYKGKIMNRVFQHEIDHMDGIINIDKVKDPKELILESDPKFYENAKFQEVKKS
ncbi:MAG: peptide deformylase [Actinobacteria bacterium]|nr:peptide deformylase [Actinomycetota bacterium]